MYNAIFKYDAGVQCICLAQCDYNMNEHDYVFSISVYMSMCEACVLHTAICTLYFNAYNLYPLLLVPFSFTYWQHLSKINGTYPPPPNSFSSSTVSAIGRPNMAPPYGYVIIRIYYHLHMCACIQYTYTHAQMHTYTYFIHYSNNGINPCLSLISILSVH